MKIEWNDYDHIDFYTKLNFVRSDVSYHHIARCLWRESTDQPTFSSPKLIYSTTM